MKKQIINLLSIIIGCTLLVSCGGNSVKESAVLGKVPSLITENDKTMNGLREKLSNASNESEAESIFKKGEELETAFKKQIEEQNEVLKNKEIATEIDKDVPFKLIKPFSIVNLNDDGVITASAEGEFTEPVRRVLDFEKFNGSSIQVVYLNKEGAPIGAASGSCSYDPPVSLDIASGTKTTIALKIKINKYNSGVMNDFAKIMIVSNSNNELQKKGYEYTRNLEKTYKDNTR